MGVWDGVFIHIGAWAPRIISPTVRARGGRNLKKIAGGDVIFTIYHSFFFA